MNALIVSGVQLNQQATLKFGLPSVKEDKTAYAIQCTTMHQVFPVCNSFWEFELEWQIERIAAAAGQFQPDSQTEICQHHVSWRYVNTTSTGDMLTPH